MAQLAMPFAQVPGLVYRPDFITLAGETAIIEFLSAQPHWIAFGTRKRRLIYGYSYAIGSGRISESAIPIPRILTDIGRRLHGEGLIDGLPEQVVAQDYPAGIGIGKHIDALAFGPQVVTLSLLSSCVMRFKNVARQQQRVDYFLEPRSVLAISGAARDQWTHEIPAHTVTARRISIAFRTVARAVPRVEDVG
jgi:alkylated DNA repair dioxygenase AlkB